MTIAPSSQSNHAALPTAFAPAERATPREFNTQINKISKLANFWDLLNTVPNILLVLNAQRQIVYANQVLFDALDITPENVIGQRPGELLDCIHADAMPGGCGTTEFCRTCGAANAILTSLDGQRASQECRITQHSGGALDLQIWANPLVIEGECFSIFAVEDISHKKRREALESIFFHDVLNLAGVVLGYAELLDPAGSVEETTRIQNILVETSARLVDEIKVQRDLVAAENGKLRASPMHLRSGQVLRRVASFYRAHDVARDRALVIAPDSEDVTFDSDPLLLERVLGNMVKNALEACAPGETVTLSSKNGGDRVRFAVHNPKAMPRRVQLQVFQRSFSTKGLGRGLGTYSMKLIGEQYLHGEVRFVSRPETGTTFTMSCPLHFPDSAH